MTDKSIEDFFNNYRKGISATRRSGLSEEDLRQLSRLIEQEPTISNRLSPEEIEALREDLKDSYIDFGNIEEMEKFVEGLYENGNRPMYQFDITEDDLDEHMFYTLQQEIDLKGTQPLSQDLLDRMFELQQKAEEAKNKGDDK